MILSSKMSAKEKEKELARAAERANAQRLAAAKAKADAQAQKEKQERQAERQRKAQEEGSSDFNKRYVAAMMEGGSSEEEEELTDQLGVLELDELEDKPLQKLLKVSVQPSRASNPLPIALTQGEPICAY